MRKLAAVVLLWACLGAAAPSGSRLSGMVYLGRNRKVVGATVLVRPIGGPAHFHLTSSDGRGEFHVDGLPDGDYRVRVEREGLVPVTKERVELRAPFRVVIELPMTPGGGNAPTPASESPAAESVTLRGRVVERGAGPLEDAVLRLVRSDRRADPRELRSGKEGVFEVAGLVPGRWRLEAHGAGLLPIRIAVDLTADSELALAMVRQPADYRPSPLELMPPEEPVPPADLPAPWRTAK